MTLKKCECEHESHFDNQMGHPYGVERNVTVPVATPFGTFHVCQDCAEDCYAQFVEQAKGVSNVS